MNEEVLSYSLRLLGRKDYFSFELKMKLKRKGFEDRDIEEVIEYLVKEKIIDDESLIRREIEYMQNKEWGEKKIVYKLRNKFLPMDFIKKGIKNYFDKEKDIENALKLMERKSDSKNIYSLLVSRGFTYPTIVEAKRKKEERR
ncbi:MAG: hypothetical protein DRI22_01715 [Caldiserica bacterium]|nr:MAG: hypothetical protein DRI28_02635 [Caldisericota bacterium]RLD16018.1 MAG: hypothetical protein DRI22_01715 [Caldisericota bacterium]